VAVTEASYEGALVSNLENLLNVGELESALSHVVLQAERVVDARHGALVVNVIRDPWVEVLRLI